MPLCRPPRSGVGRATLPLVTASLAQGLVGQSGKRQDPASEHEHGDALGDDQDARWSWLHILLWSVRWRWLHAEHQLGGF